MRVRTCDWRQTALLLPWRRLRIARGAASLTGALAAYAALPCTVVIAFGCTGSACVLDAAHSAFRLVAFCSMTNVKWEISGYGKAYVTLVSTESVGLVGIATVSELGPCSPSF